MTFATLHALHASIGRAIEDLEGIYRERSQVEPLDYPRLEDPYYADGLHSAGQELAQRLTHEDPAVSLASKRVVAACGQLSATVSKPGLSIAEAVHAAQLTAAIRFMEAAHIPEILREVGPQGLHVEDIHRTVMELRPGGLSPDPAVLTRTRLAHVLRALATAHWLQEVAPDVFANNRRSSYIDTGKTLQQLRTEPHKKYDGANGIAASVALSGDESHKFAAYLTEWLLPGTRAGSLMVDAKGGPACSSGGAPGAHGSANGAAVRYAAPFNLAFDTELYFFPWAELPENRVRLERFGHAMHGTRYWWERKDEILQGFPWADLAPGSVLVDVGGGIGSTSMTVAQAYPHIHVVVEDRPQVVEFAPASWGPEYASLFESGRMSFRARDLFAPWVPLASGKAPDVFLLRIVLHDWKDEESRTILRQLRSAAGPDTKLLIGDMLLPYACSDQDPFVNDYAPLLPNLGMGNIHGYLMDVMMMAMTGSKERTVDEMSNLALSTGWKIDMVKRSPGSVWAYTTAVPV
ncbi:S-adenosyl-L-methionine-dependent methyltransferase [Trametes cingulata]|nr:S-adenosyl-L-methionine-dependent methyltransferase [Trametes cingulata]